MAFVRGRILTGQRGCECSDIGLCLWHGDAWFESRDTLEQRFTPISDCRSHFRGQELFRHCERQPEIGTDETIHADESRLD